MIKLTNPTIAHADAVIRLAERLLNESQQLLNQISRIDHHQHLTAQTKQLRVNDLNEKVQFHVMVLRDIIKQEHTLIASGIQRINADFQYGSLKQQMELKSLKEKSLKLHELSHLTEEQRAVTLSPSRFFSQPAALEDAEEQLLDFDDALNTALR
jgi:hypothetical protein